MSDSDDDVPLGQRLVAPKETAAAAPAAKPKVVKDDSSDSDDDKPIAARQLPPSKLNKCDASGSHVCARLNQVLIMFTHLIHLITSRLFRKS